jgi:hypothetical protein
VSNISNLSLVNADKQDVLETDKVIVDETEETQLSAIDDNQVVTISLPFSKIWNLMLLQRGVTPEAKDDHCERVTFCKSQK